LAGLAAAGWASPRPARTASWIDGYWAAGQRVREVNSPFSRKQQKNGALRARRRPISRPYDTLQKKVQRARPKFGFKTEPRAVASRSQVAQTGYSMSVIEAVNLDY
jgi:hypothetical protein